MANKIFTFLKKYWSHILCVILLIIVGLFVYKWYNDTYVKKPVTFESQKEASTPEGVDRAAQNAQVYISPTQSKEIAHKIEYIYTNNVQPEYIVPTTAKDVEKTAKEEEKKNKADFSIVTNPDKPDEQFDFSKYKENTPINLNQYNIHAYKKVIRSVSYAPTEKIVGVSIQQKINDHGTYMGVGVDYDIDDKKVYGKIIVSW